MAENTEVLSAYVAYLRRIWARHGSPSAEEVASRTQGKVFPMSALQVEEYLRGETFPGSSLELHVLLYGITDGYGLAWSKGLEEHESEVTRVFRLWGEVTGAPEEPATSPLPAVPDHAEPPKLESALPPLPQPSIVEATVNHLAGGMQQGVVVQAGAIGGDVTINEAPDPLAIHPVPVIVTMTFTDASARHLEQSMPDVFYRPAHSVSVLVEGRSARAVILHALRVVVEARRPVKRQPDVTGGLHSAIMPRRCFNLNLSSEEPCLYPQHGQPDFPFTVSAADPELFEIDPGVYQHEVDFRLALDWSCAGQSGTVLVPETGVFRKGPDCNYTFC